MKVRWLAGMFICILLIVCTLLMIWGLSLQPPAASGQTSSYVASWLYSLLQLEGVVAFAHFAAFVRKLAHFTEYALLALESTALLLLVLSHGARKPRLWNGGIPLAFGVLVAVIDETIQYFVGRVASLWDVLLDSAGTAVGVLLLFAFYLLFCNKKERAQKS